MRPLKLLGVATLISALAFPASACAQIIRDSTRVAPPKPAELPGAPVPRAAPAPPVPKTPAEVARAEQEAFEKYRHFNLPHVGSRVFGQNCEERVGRLCYWYDESAKMPRETPSVTRERTKFLAVLDSLARIVPTDFWITQQRVRYLAEADRLPEALVVARACADYAGQCKALEGFTLHLMGDYVAAEAVYDDALSRMGPKERCEWRTIYLLLDDVAIGAYRTLPCGSPAREAWEVRTWFLARTLYSMKGNDSRTEYFARMTMAGMMERAASAYHFGFDNDEREILLRFGWPRAWAAEAQLPFTMGLANTGDGGRGGIPGGGGGGGSGGMGPNVGGAKGRGRGGTPVGSYPPGTRIPSNVPPLVRPPDIPGTQGLPGGVAGPIEDQRNLPQLPRVAMRPREGDGINVVGIEPFPAYRYIPAGFVLADPVQTDSAAWRLQLPPVMGRYAPPYATQLVPLEHQKAVFKRGDSAIVVMAYETKGTAGVDGAKLRAALVVSPVGATPRDYVAVRESAAASGVLTVRAPWGPLLMSAEIAAPERKAVARARYGVGPVRAPESRVMLSDLLFYKTYGTAPTSVEEVAPHALPTERMRATDKLGVYWEAYGTNPGGEKIKVSLVVARERPEEERGFFGRIGRTLGIARERTPVSVSIEDLSARGSSTSSRAIEFDISTLTKGAYIVQLEIDVAGQPTLRAEHRIEVVGQ